MIFNINQSAIEPVKSTWYPKEIEIEKYILPPISDERILHPSVFGEQLFLIRSQMKTKQGKKADILALDRLGNAVIIELKRDAGALGVETQALQYLVDFSLYKGRHFIAHFSKTTDSINEGDVRGFLGGNVSVDEINRNSRIILIARRFDPSLFSMGEWLSNKGVAFRCIEYTPFQSGNDNYISFSIAFDRTPIPLYPLFFENQMRNPGYYWHNIGRPINEWWNFLVKNKIITADFDNQPGDQGERLLRGYISGDIIIAYASGYGAIGWGIIDDNKPYYLTPKGSKDDFLNGSHLHRRGVNWRTVARNLEDCLHTNFIRDMLDIYHPVGTSANIQDEKAKRLIKKIDENIKVPDNTKH
jgi:hypothetical protein